MFACQVLFFNHQTTACKIEKTCQMWRYTLFNPTTQKDANFCVIKASQVYIASEFQTSQDYIVRPYLKK